MKDIKCNKYTLKAGECQYYDDNGNNDFVSFEMYYIYNENIITEEWNNEKSW